MRPLAQSAHGGSGAGSAELTADDLAAAVPEALQAESDADKWLGLDPDAVDAVAEPTDGALSPEEREAISPDLATRPPMPAAGMPPPPARPRPRRPQTPGRPQAGEAGFGGESTNPDDLVAAGFGAAPARGGVPTGDVFADAAFGGAAPVIPEMGAKLTAGRARVGAPAARRVRVPPCRPGRASVRRRSPARPPPRPPASTSPRRPSARRPSRRPRAAPPRPHRRPTAGAPGGGCCSA